MSRGALFQCLDFECDAQGHPMSLTHGQTVLLVEGPVYSVVVKIRVPSMPASPFEIVGTKVAYVSIALRWPISPK